MIMSSWKKGKQLGSGTYGTVHLATSASSPTPMAVKSVDGSLSFAVDSLNREAELFRRLAGAPNVVQSFGKYQSEENNRPTHNLLLEYAPYGSLDDVIKKHGPMPPCKVARYASQLLRGIAAIHSRGLVHCDLKSANVLVFPAGQNQEDVMELKIADLGLAKLVSEGLYKHTPTWEGSPGKRYYNAGTAATASPESVLCRSFSGEFGYHGPSNDVWSVGCIIYEMLTGNGLWNFNGNPESLYYQILNCPIPALPRNLSQEGVHFMMCCLDKNWSSRWSAEALLMHPFIVNNSKHPRRTTSCYYKNTAGFNTGCGPQVIV